MAKLQKALNISLKIICWLLVAFTVVVLIFTVISATTLDRNDRGIFGYKFFLVLSDSMSPSENNKDMEVTFSVNDIVIIKEVADEDKYKLKEGDIISFLYQGEDNGDLKFGDTVTHMIREVIKDGKGSVTGYRTFGTNTGANDEAILKPEYVIGTYAAKLPKLGYFFNFMKTTAGYIICILLPFLLLILYNGVNVIRALKSIRSEEKAKVEAERKEIEADRQRNEEVLRELLALKAELERKNAADNADMGNTETTPEKKDVSEDNGQA